MGQPMARHLNRVGLLRAVCNRTSTKTKLLAEELGVLGVADPAELGQHCNAVVLCVSADADVLALTRTIADSAVVGMTVIDHSTVSSATAKQARTLMLAAGGDFLDAPVSGGVEGAKNGKLSVMVGGDADTLQRMRPLLEAYALRISHMGDSGAGQNAKAVNQVLVAGIAQAVCEGLALSEKLGLDPTILLPTLSAGAAGSWFLDKRGASMLRNEFSIGFKLALLHKDLNIVRELALTAGTESSVVERSLSDYAALMAKGYGDEDISALIRLKRAGSMPANDRDE